MKSHRLGVGGQAEIGYRAMLTRPRWQPDELARALAWPPERAAAVLAELCAEGLVMASSVEVGAMRAVQPCLALPALAASRLGGGRMPTAAAVETFVSLHEQTTGRLDDATPLFDMDEVTAVVERLAARVRNEIVVLAPCYDPRSFEFAEHIAEGVLRRGAGLRAVWKADVAATSFAMWLANRGVGPRVAENVPVRAVVVDGLVGVVVDEAGSGRVVRDDTELSSLAALADRLWVQSVAVSQVRKAPPTRSRHELVLRMLAQGLTDDAIARRLGVSVRTVRGDVASAMVELDARSRFQAGVRAMQMGLL
ncbi:helix-turn-helix transcriptional regulator [Actinocrispum wychmicini]|uniref:Regulatory LuxR family protein n=1 Tax=Actinocrispum wychmicini TaxID=1213861 RepID=A0A4R2JQY1_9PSEU|nr:LuxR C-terminal-related transcriptional regulator [Actinocrispum wychmicini]TCO62653.1 regulatory LuxR family protein [Actinocrispum wychmicini]